ncbi:MAG TPA: hypothetical protein VMH86_03745 [Rhizomicrobium sp.]|nr:hypothetical protein [Rhizomicrobium sp.]
MGRWTAVGTIALAVVLAAGGALARGKPVKCANPDEVTAIQTAAVQQELMVAALTCNEIDHFNAFQTTYGPELRTSDARLEHMFKRIFGAGRGEAQYHAFKTRLANDSSMSSIHDNSAYCHAASGVFAAALVASKPALADFVSGVAVTEASPVDSCELRVASGSLQGLPTAVIVPKPNPLRLAMVMPAQPAPAPAAPAPEPVTTAPAAAAQAPQDAPKQEPKKDTGWFSGLFGH